MKILRNSKGWFAKTILDAFIMHKNGCPFDRGEDRDTKRSEGQNE
jgi:hypothetical protein